MTWSTHPRCAEAEPQPTKRLATQPVFWLEIFHTRSFQMMVETGSMRVMEILSEATNIIAEGEVLQLMNMHDASLSEADYLKR